MDLTSMLKYKYMHVYCIYVCIQVNSHSFIPTSSITVLLVSSPYQLCYLYLHTSYNIPTSTLDLSGQFHVLHASFGQHLLL